MTGAKSSRKVAKNCLSRLNAADRAKAQPVFSNIDIFSFSFVTTHPNTINNEQKIKIEFTFSFSEYGHRYG